MSAPPDLYAAEASNEAGYAERRRSQRVPLTLWVKVIGVDRAPRLRTGDMGVTGLYVDHDQAVGSPGDLVWLHLISSDKRRSLRLLGRVTRLVRQDNLQGGATMVGAGFELLPDAAIRPELISFVRDAALTSAAERGVLPFSSAVSGTFERPDGSLHAMQAWAWGEDQLLVTSPASPGPGEQLLLRLDGTAGDEVTGLATVAAATASRRAHDTGMFRLKLTLAARDRHAAATGLGLGGDLLRERALRRGALPTPAVSAATVALGPPHAWPPSESERRWAALPPLESKSIAELLVAPSRSCTASLPRADFAAQLTRVRLASILELVETTRSTTVLIVANEQSCARIYAREGQLVDVEMDGEPSSDPARLLESLLAWPEGEVSALPLPVARGDRLGSTGTALLRRSQQEHPSLWM